MKGRDPNKKKSCVCLPYRPRDWDYISNSFVMQTRMQCNVARLLLLQKICLKVASSSDTVIVPHKAGFLPIFWDIDSAPVVSVKLPTHFSYLSSSSSSQDSFRSALTSRDLGVFLTWHLWRKRVITQICNKHCSRYNRCDNYSHNSGPSSYPPRYLITWGSVRYVAMRKWDPVCTRTPCHVTNAIRSLHQYDNRKHSKLRSRYKNTRSI
jgi:hypothetical protein